MRIIGALLALILLSLCAPAAPAKSRRPRVIKSSATSKKKASIKPGRKGRIAAAKRIRQASPSPDRYIEIQQALASKGFYRGELNGEWGPESVAALKQFQQAQNLKPDGKLGALSLISLGLGPKHDNPANVE